jgi:arginyl-tRNA synthetase
MEPQILANYLQSLASLFHKFYSNNKVISDDEKLSFARLKLICGIKHVLKNGLDILGINAPEKM